MMAGGTGQPRVVDATEGRTVECFGTRYTIKVSAADSGGAIGIVEDVVPAGDGPPMHVHHHEDEVFHVLEGTFQVWCDDRTWTAGPGAVIFLPRGVPHTFRNVGAGEGRKVITVVPGGFEGFFVAVAERGLRIPEDMDELTALAAAYGLAFTGPPPWA